MANQQTHNILLLADNPYLGGVSSHILSVLEAFETDPAFSIVPAFIGGRRADRWLADRAAGFSPREFDMRHPFDPRILRSLRTWVRDNQIDLVHTHGYRGTIIADAARLGIPVITTWHGDLVAPTPRLRLWQAITRRLVKCHPLTIACADFVRDGFIRSGLPAESVRTVYNGVKPPPAESPATARHTLGLDPEKLVLFYAGRLVPGKGLDTLILAMRGEHGVQTVIAGHGPLRAELEKLAREAGTDVLFTGLLDDPAPYLSLCDAVVLASRMEALPMLLIEAAAHGKAAISCPVGGVPEIVRNEETGLLVPPDDPQALARAVERIKEPAVRDALGRAAHARWTCLFSPERMHESLAQAYRDACEKRP